MNNNNVDYSNNQLSIPQSNQLRTFSFINLYGDTVLISARDVSGLADSLTSMLTSAWGTPQPSSILDMSSQLWNGQVVIDNALELIIVPNGYSVYKLDIEFLYFEDGNRVVVSSDFYLGVDL